MKTLEERAREYSLKDFDGYYTGREKAVEEGYIAGATEQKAIDEEVRLKKCDDMTQAAKNKCRDLMVGDWITNRNGFPMQITNVGEDYAYATFEGNEGDPWEFDDKDDQPQPIPLTPEILEKNGWKETEYWHEYEDGNTIIQYSLSNIWGIEIEHFKCEYVHQLQHLIRLCGLDELADNFKV